MNKRRRWKAKAKRARLVRHIVTQSAREFVTDHLAAYTTDMDAIAAARRVLAQRPRLMQRLAAAGD